MKNADMPAMPTQSNGGDIFGGLTKREMMAMHILSGLLAAPDMKDATPDQLTQASVKYADKLLTELGRTSK